MPVLYVIVVVAVVVVAAAVVVVSNAVFLSSFAFNITNKAAAISLGQLILAAR